MTELLVQALVEMKEAEALRRAKQLLAEGSEPLKILESCSRAMEIVGQRFEKGVYFLPHLMMAGEMLKQITSMIKPLIQEQKTGNKGGKVLIGTVEGDIHDIGKNIVVFVLEANGFDVRDLGINQKPEKFVEAINEGIIHWHASGLFLHLKDMPWILPAFEADGNEFVGRLLMELGISQPEKKKTAKTTS